MGERLLTPVVPLRGKFRSNHIFCEAEQTLFASFSGKRRILYKERSFAGTSPQTPMVPLRGRFGSNHTFCEAEQTLFASFSGKRRKLLVD
jgi:hypothetical protein